MERSDIHDSRRIHPQHRPPGGEKQNRFEPKKGADGLFNSTEQIRQMKLAMPEIYQDSRNRTWVKSDSKAHEKAMSRKQAQEEFEWHAAQCRTIEGKSEEIKKEKTIF